MNLRQMEVFRAIMRTGSITGAARSLNISQPSVTGMLKHTESSIGFRLFERVKGKLIATAEAERLYDEVDTLFERVQMVSQSVDELREGRLGTLRIVTLASLSLSVIPSLLGRFIQSRPGIRVRLLQKRRSELIEMVARGAADLGVSFHNKNDSRIIRHELSRKGLSCIMPIGHPLTMKQELTVEDLREFPLVGYAVTDGFGSMVNGMIEEARLSHQRTAEVDGVVQAWALVEGGAGIGLVDGFSDLRNLYPHVELRPLQSRLAFSLDVIVPAHEKLSQMSTMFLKTLPDHKKSSAK